MFYIIIGFFLGFLIMGYFYAFEWDLDKIEKAIFLSLVFYTLVFVIIGVFCDVAKVDYETYSENYVLKGDHENQYYTVHPDGNSISVWVMDGEECKEKTFDKEKVKFQPAGRTSEVLIKAKKMKEPSITDKLFFFKCIDKQKKEIVESVVITVPETSDMTNQLTVHESENELREEKERWKY